MRLLITEGRDSDELVLVLEDVLDEPAEDV
jgi:hypothetical protein